MSRAIVCAIAVFLVVVSSVIVNASLTSANAVVIPEMQKVHSSGVQKNDADAAIVSRAYIKNPIFGT